MVPTMFPAMAFTRPSHPYQGTLLERLRRAGYADGERLPRHASHWLNR